MPNPLQQMVVADSALVWRLWIVWLRDYRIMVIPVIAWLGLLGCGLAVLILDVIQTLAGKNASWETRYQSTAAALIYISMGLNWLVTGLIVGRLWWADRKLKATYRSADSAPRTSYTKIMVALIESGAFYSIYLVAYLIGNYAGNVSYGKRVYDNSGLLIAMSGRAPGNISSCTLFQWWSERFHVSFNWYVTQPSILDSRAQYPVQQRSLGFLQPNETVNGTGASFTKASSVRPTNVHLAVRMETHTELTNYTDRTRPSEKTPARPSQGTPIFFLGCAKL